MLAAPTPTAWRPVRFATAGSTIMVWACSQ